MATNSPRQVFAVFRIRFQTRPLLQGSHPNSNLLLLWSYCTVPLIRVLVTDMSEIDRVQERIAALEIEIGGVKAEIGGVKAQIAALEIEIARVKGDKDWMLLGEIERARIDRLEENKIVSLREEKIVLQKKEIVLREEKNILQARLPAISRGTLYCTLL